MPTLDRNGVTIYYEVHGNGPPFCSRTAIAPPPQCGTARSRPSRTATRSSYGTCAATARAPTRKIPPRYSEALTVADIAAILDACGEKRAVIGGLSLGGYMSLASTPATRTHARADAVRHRPRLQEG